jgi:hypothetical protein
VEYTFNLTSLNGPILTDNGSVALVRQKGGQALLISLEPAPQLGTRSAVNRSLSKIFADVCAAFTVPVSVETRRSASTRPRPVPGGLTTLAQPIRRARQQPFHVRSSPRRQSRPLPRPRTYQDRPTTSDRPV